MKPADGASEVSDVEHQRTVIYVVRGRMSHNDRPALPAGHPVTWGLITDGIGRAAGRELSVSGVRQLSEREGSPMKGIVIAVGLSLVVWVPVVVLVWRVF